MHVLSLKAVHNNGEWLEHLQLIEMAMILIFEIGVSYEQPTERQQTLKIIGVRLFNAAATSLKLAMAGYYQMAFNSVRDILETTNLLDFFLIDECSIDMWKTGGESAKRKFKPDEVRKALDKRDGYQKRRRGATYGTYSEYASHPTYAGSKLVANSLSGLVNYGPFLEDKKLGHFLFDLAKYLAHGTCVFMQHFPVIKAPLSPLVKRNDQFSELVVQWKKRFLE